MRHGKRDSLGRGKGREAMSGIEFDVYVTGDKGEMFQRDTATKVADVEVRDAPLWWQLRGLSYTRTGYGRKIPTSKMLRLPGSKRWRRVYCAIYGNAGTCYVTLKGGAWLVVH